MMLASDCCELWVIRAETATFESQDSAAPEAGKQVCDPAKIACCASAAVMKLSVCPTKAS